jgi:hypothetical protein
LESVWVDAGQASGAAVKQAATVTFSMPAADPSWTPPPIAYVGGNRMSMPATSWPASTGVAELKAVVKLVGGFVAS